MDEITKDIEIENASSAKEIIDLVYSIREEGWNLGVEQIEGKTVEVMYEYVTHEKGLYVQLLHSLIMNSVLYHMGFNEEYADYEIEFAEIHPEIVEQIASIFRSLYRNYRIKNGLVPPFYKNVKSITLSDITPNVLEIVNINSARVLNTGIVDGDETFVDMDESLLNLINWDSVDYLYGINEVNIEGEVYLKVIPAFKNGSPNYIQLKKDGVFYILKEGDEKFIKGQVYGDMLARTYGFTASSSKLVTYNDKLALLCPDLRQYNGTEKVSQWDGKAKTIEEIYNCYADLGCENISNFSKILLFDYIYQIMRDESNHRLTITESSLLLDTLFNNNIFDDSGKRSSISGDNSYIANVINFLNEKGYAETMNEFMKFHDTLNLTVLLRDDYTTEQIDGARDRAKEIKDYLQNEG